MGIAIGKKTGIAWRKRLKKQIALMISDK